MFDLSTSDPIEQSRKDHLKEVEENLSTEYDRKYTEKQQQIENDQERFVREYELPPVFQSTSDFAMNMLQDYVTNDTKRKQRLAKITHDKKRNVL